MGQSWLEEGSEVGEWAARGQGRRDQRGPRAAWRGCAAAKQGLIIPAHDLGLSGLPPALFLHCALLFIL